MKHRIAVVAIAAAALVAVACQDRDGGTRRLATEPGGALPEQGAHYITTGVAAVVGSNHRLQTVAASAPPRGASASVVAANGPTSAMTLTNNEPGIANTGGRRNSSFVDSNKHQHIVSMLYSSIGGPPVAVQHYVDGKLVSTTAFGWQRTTTGWVRTRSLLQSVQGGRLFGTYTTTTSQAPVGGGGGGTKPTVRLDRPAQPTALQKMIGGAAYHLAFIFAPQDATAQSLAFSACSQYWLRYAAAAAVVAGLEAVIAEAPIIGPLLVSQFAAALSLLAAAEDQLLDCVLSHQPIPTIDNWSSGMGGGTGSGAGGGGDSNKDCLEGSYAAHCTTAFTL